MTEPKSDAERIAELEAEVARLRREVPPGETPTTPVSQVERAAPEVQLGPSSKSKVILVAALILVGALIIFGSIFIALSRGFHSIADKAAQVIVPGEESPGGAKEPVRPKKEESPTRFPVAPGL